jgi:hypothetical protein
MPTTTHTSWFKKVLTWLDNNVILLLTAFLLIFIPLFPKLPLFEAIPGYIVRVRLEDIVVLVTAVIWFVQVKRGKAQWQIPGKWLLIAYAGFGLLSLVSAVFLIHTIPLQPLHIAKSVLHYFRYLEYFTLLLFVYAAIKTKRDVVKLITVLFLTLFAIALYGYGQKNFYWPVYSTMNREFSKGVRLYLTDHARVQSTFGGHYDLAAYLVVILPIVLALAFKVKHPLAKLGLHALHALGVWLMIVAASRTSFGGYILAVTWVILLFAWKQVGWKARLWWATSRGFLTFALLATLMTFFGKDIYDRLLQALEGYPEAHYYFHHYNDERKKLGNKLLVAVGLRMPEKAAPPAGSIGVTEQDQMPENVVVSSDQRPTNEKPSDVYVDVPDQVKVATTSASGSATTVTVDVPRTYSANALKYGLSVAIRLDTLWPRAIAGFWRNPLLGSGYATLTKESVEQFTEAESTDNNFLRTLGETGLLGFLTFYGMALTGVGLAWQLFKKADDWSGAVGIGFIAASFGLFLNATYIDVFAASKVAFMYWALVGLVMALYRLMLATKKP